MFTIQETFRNMDVGMATNDITVGKFDDKFHQVSSMNPMRPQCFSSVKQVALYLTAVFNMYLRNLL